MLLHKTNENPGTYNLITHVNPLTELKNPKMYYTCYEVMKVDEYKMIR